MYLSTHDATVVRTTWCKPTRRDFPVVRLVEPASSFLSALRHFLTPFASGSYREVSHSQIGSVVPTSPLLVEEGSNMFGTMGFSELIIILVIVLIIFGAGNFRKLVKVSARR